MALNESMFLHPIHPLKTQPYPSTPALQDPGTLANDLSQLSLSGGSASTVGGGSSGPSVGSGVGGRAARVASSSRGGGAAGGIYGPGGRAGQAPPGPGQGPGPSFSLQDVRKGGLGPASRN